MSLSGLLSALNEYTGDVLVNDCGRPVPRVLRYHGTMPHDCCDADGVLVTSWEQETPGGSAGGAGGRSGGPCASPPGVNLLVRYVVCWPIPTFDEQSGVTLLDDEWDAQAAMLTDVAACVTSALIRLSCQPGDDDELAQAVLELVGRDSVKWTATVPIPALGGCAGVLWRLTATLRDQAVVS